MDSSGSVGFGWSISVNSGPSTGSGFGAGIVTDTTFESLRANPYQDIEITSWGDPPVPAVCDTYPNPWCSNYKHPSSSHKRTDGGKLDAIAASGQYHFFVCSYDYTQDLQLSFAFGTDASGRVLLHMHRAFALATFVSWFL